MGMTRQAAWVLGIFFSVVLVNPCLSGEGASLETRPWPTAKNCETCIPIQFGKLEMSLPLSEIGRILVVGSGDSVLHILPKSNITEDGVLFLTMSPERLMGAYKNSGLLKKLGIATTEQFFDALGKLPGNNKSLAIMRRIEHIDVADSYIKTSKGSVHVYWIKSSFSGRPQRVYFVIDGEETVYLLAGNVTPEFYAETLANLRVVNVP